MSQLTATSGLVVGIAAYRRLRPLPATVVNDATAVHEILTDPAFGGHSPERTRKLVDAGATKAGLLQALAGLARNSDRESVVFIYLSGHGARIEEGPYAGQYLLPVDTVADSPARVAESAISGDELSRALHAIPARKLLVIFDCCHAGGIGELKDPSAPKFKLGVSDRYLESVQAGHGRAILASSRSDEYSFVMPQASNSLFTQHFLTGLRGGVQSDDGLVRIFDLFEYIQPRVTADQPNQHPVFKADLEDNFPVASWQGGRTGFIPTSPDGFRYDAYISYVDREPDATWIWSELVPRLERAGLRVAVSGDVEQPGVARVVGIERGIQQSRRTVVALSPAYLSDGVAEFENVLAQTIGIQQGRWRVLPVRIADLTGAAVPARLDMLTSIDLTRVRRADRDFDRLLAALREPVPRRE